MAEVAKDAKRYAALAHVQSMGALRSAWFGITGATIRRNGRRYCAQRKQAPEHVLEYLLDLHDKAVSES